MKKPKAPDWEEIKPGLEYSRIRKLYWHNGKVYDHTSAAHNGLIGVGAILKETIKEK